MYQAGQAGTKKAKAHAKTQRRKVAAKFFSFAFLCENLAALRLCVNAFNRFCCGSPAGVAFTLPN